MTAAESQADAARDTDAGPAYLAGPQAGLVVAGIFLAILLAGMDALVVATVLPKIGASLGNSDDLTFVSSVYLIASTISIPIFSRLSDLSSRRNVFLIALAIFIGGSAIAGLSQNLGELILFRGIQGFGSGAFLPVGIAMVALLFPPKTRSRLTGVLSGAAGIAIVVGPLLGSYIVEVTTWRWVFYVNLPIGIAAAVILGTTLGPLKSQTRGHFDAIGAGLLSGWVTALMLPLVEVSATTWTWTQPITLALLAAAFVLFGLFLAWELRERDPMVPLRLLGRRVLGTTGTMSLFTGVSLTSMFTFLSILIGIDLGHSEALIRDVLYFFAVPLILAAMLSGQLMTRFAYRTVLAPGLLAGGVAALFLSRLTPTTPLWVLWGGFLPVGGLVLPLMIFGFGTGFGLAGVTIAVQNEVPREEVGAGIGLVRFLQSVGGAVGLSLLTLFLSWQTQLLLPAVPSPSGDLAALVSAFDRVFLIMAVLTITAGVVALFVPGRIAPRGAERPAETAPPAPLTPDRNG
jgi:EmrB/QacA subfamily drug resistance transporter